MTAVTLTFGAGDGGTFTFGAAAGATSVSYTHLTLPTICGV